MTDTNTTPAQTDERPKQLLLYIGWRTDGLRSDSDVHAICYAITPEQLANASLPEGFTAIEEIRRPYDITLSRDLCSTIGGVYEVTKTDTGISYKPHAAPVAIWANESLRAKWRAEHHATKSAHAALQRLQREGKRNLIDERLDPIRKAYARLHAPQQAQLIADVVAYIVRGPQQKTTPTRKKKGAKTS